MSRCPVTGSYKCRCGKNNQTTEQKSISIKETLRKLFTDHAVYTKFYISSYINNNKDSSNILDRLRDNQKEIGDYLVDFIDEENGAKMTELLLEHIKMAANGVKALKTNINIQIAVELIFSNSKLVSEFISSFNPEKLPYETVKIHFDRHNQYVIDIAKFTLENKYDDEIKTYDEYYNHILMFSDLLSSALSPSSSISNPSIKPEQNSATYYKNKYLKYKSKYINKP